MAAIVCHGFQSCLEPHQLAESRALTLSFPFSSKPHQNPIDVPFKATFWDSNSKIQEKQSNKTEPNTGLSFLQILSSVSKEPTEKESVYIHPETKRSSAAMSQKSLELCTEKLGNETGSDIVENNGYDGDIMGLLCSSPTREQQERPRQQGCLGGGGRRTRNQNFPPPLTTMRGSESLRVRSHREDGRLVVQAIRVPPSASCFRADRSHGRLRLCFLKNQDNYFDPEETKEIDDNGGLEEECESDGEDSERRNEIEEAEEEEEEEEGEGEETEEGEEMRRKEYERPRRCREGREHENNYELLNNWGEPLSVAIS